MKKTILILGIICLLVSVSLNSTIAVFNSNDDTTPPVTTHTLDPPTPDGDNGWYVSDVTGTLNATDDMSGVMKIKYRIDNGPNYTIIGDDGTFVIDIDKANLSIEYWAIDNVGNEEIHHIFVINMDQSEPVISSFTHEWFETPEQWYAEFIAVAIDNTSGMNRLEFGMNDVIQEIVMGSGPIYKWIFVYHGWPKWFTAIAYDNAGHEAFNEIRLTRNNRINIQQSTHPYSLRFLDHFPFLHRLFDIWR